MKSISACIFGVALNSRQMDPTLAASGPATLPPSTLSELSMSTTFSALQLSYPDSKSKIRVLLRMLSKSRINPRNFFVVVVTLAAVVGLAKDLQAEMQSDLFSKLFSFPSQPL